MRRACSSPEVGPEDGTAVGVEAVGVLGPGVGSEDGNGGGATGGPSFT